LDAVAGTTEGGAGMNPEAGAFYYDTRDHVLAYCATGSILFGLVCLYKVNAADSEDRNASCSLEYFRANYKKVAFLTNREVHG